MNVIVDRLIKKALQSSCEFRVSAVAFDHRGDVLGYAQNMPNLINRKGGHHAEMRLIKRYGRRIASIILCRVSPKGELRPIHPCRMCARKIAELDIQVATLTGV